VQALRPALEKLDPQRAFQLAQRDAHCRRPQSKGARGAGDAAVTRDGDEDAELAKGRLYRHVRLSRTTSP
jgi:hypothetical protein